jgi:hypothetical protein
LKVTVYDWAGAARNKILDLGLIHGTELDVTEDRLWEMAKKVFDSGLEVMIARQANGGVLLGIDVKGGKFKQR